MEWRGGRRGGGGEERGGHVGRGEGSDNLPGYKSSDKILAKKHNTIPPDTYKIHYA